jgi:hypothetical protein
MTSYLLRSVDDALWRRVAQQAETQGITIRAALMLLLQAYADGQVVIGAIQPK